MGCLNDSAFYNMTKTFFPNSKIIQFNSYFDIYRSLLFEEIEGFLIDKPIVDYFVNRFPERVSYYPDIFDQNNYGFGFQKNEEGENLLKEFNEL